ncbi:MAG: PEP-CTERM sorting domain-containing protein [Phycisphaerae bacterium]|nr:PEP-CTERM sorting domain-containing protein [Phycisphaerae bacterium]
MNRMNRLGSAVCAAVLCVSLVSGAAADQIVAGTLYETQSSYGNTVDHWLVTVNTPGTVVFDILAYENTVDVTEQDGTAGGLGTNLDVNGDGEYAYFDSLIYLGQYTGAGIVMVGGNDDDGDDGGSPQGTADGSVVDEEGEYLLDSYLSSSLGVGNYLLLVGTWNDVEGLGAPTQQGFDAFLTGVVEQGPYPTLFGEGGLASDHGDYQVTITGEISASLVPEPATLGLMCLGGLAVLMRKRKA